MPSCVALIPARSGSKRVVNKNIRTFAGHPLMAYTISAALESRVFDAVICSTDSSEYAEIARYYGAEIPFLRSCSISGDTSPDIEWVDAVLQHLEAEGRSFDCFSILRPTSPFRLPTTIHRAWDLFKKAAGVDSLRAVELCSQHPGKMWIVRNNRMLPLLSCSPAEKPWHSSQYAALPEVYVQNASLEIAWTRVVRETGTIAGTTILPFFTNGVEGLDINSEFDWVYLDYLVKQKNASLPIVSQSSYLR